MYGKLGALLVCWLVGRWACWVVAWLVGHWQLYQKRKVDQPTQPDQLTQHPATQPTKQRFVTHHKNTVGWCIGWFSLSVAWLLVWRLVDDQ